MAVSHQSGTILHHWNDPPSSTFTKNKSASSSTISLGLPTPPLTPSQDMNEDLAYGLKGLLELRTNLVGRTKDMIFTRVRGLIKAVEDRRLPESQMTMLEEIIEMIKQGESGIARDKIVKMMSEERGIAAWATALRILIENIL